MVALDRPAWTRWNAAKQKGFISFNRAMAFEVENSHALTIEAAKNGRVKIEDGQSVDRSCMQDKNKI